MTWRSPSPEARKAQRASAARRASIAVNPLERAEYKHGDKWIPCDVVRWPQSGVDAWGGVSLRAGLVWVDTGEEQPAYVDDARRLRKIAPSEVRKANDGP